MNQRRPGNLHDMDMNQSDMATLTTSDNDQLPMTSERYDFIVIGTGLAGLAAAMTAAKAEKKVLVIEKEGSLGGVCVNTGTFPSKTLREAVLHLTDHLKRNCSRMISALPRMQKYPWQS